MLDAGISLACPPCFQSLMFTLKKKKFLCHGILSEINILEYIRISYHSFVVGYSAQNIKIVVVIWKRSN
jgi:hypothetical protein